MAFSEWLKFLGQVLMPDRKGEGRMKKLILLLVLGIIFVFPDPAAAYKAVAVPDGGTISGKVTFKGSAPEPQKILITKDEGVCGKGDRVLKEVNVSGEGALGGVVVYLDKIKSGKAWKKPSGGYLIDQKKCRFHPHLQVIKKGAKVTVLNSDTVTHNIHTYSLIPTRRRTLKKTLFNVRQTTRGHRFTTKVKPRRGRGVKINCDIHNFMLAWMFVLDHPYYAIVGEDGSFTIKDIPQGNYSLKAWHPTLGTKKSKVKLSSGGKAKILFEFSSK